MIRKSLDYFKWIRDNGFMPVNLEQGKIIPFSNKAIKRLIEQGAITVNNEKIDLNTILDTENICEIVFFPNGKRRTTIGIINKSDIDLEPSAIVTDLCTILVPYESKVE